MAGICHKMALWPQASLQTPPLPSKSPWWTVKVANQQSGQLCCSSALTIAVCCISNCSHWRHARFKVRWTYLNYSDPFILILIVMFQCFKLFKGPLGHLWEHEVSVFDRIWGHDGSFPQFINHTVCMFIKTSQL